MSNREHRVRSELTCERHALTITVTTQYQYTHSWDAASEKGLGHPFSLTLPCSGGRGLSYYPLRVAHASCEGVGGNSGCYQVKPKAILQHSNGWNLQTHHSAVPNTEMPEKSVVATTRSRIEGGDVSTKISQRTQGMPPRPEKALWADRMLALQPGLLGKSSVKVRGSEQILLNLRDYPQKKRYVEIVCKKICRCGC